MTDQIRWLLIAFMLAVSFAGCVVCALSGCDSVAWGGRVEVRL
jgi:hypothetical protein